MAENDGRSYLLALLGGAVVGAVVENAASRPARQTAFQQAYNKGWSDGCQAQANADRAELQRLQWIVAQRSELLQYREAEIACLNGIVANQTKALAELVVTAELPAPKHPPTNGHSPQ